jgi:hypothetical protein
MAREVTDAAECKRAELAMKLDRPACHPIDGRDLRWGVTRRPPVANWRPMRLIAVVPAFALLAGCATGQAPTAAPTTTPTSTAVTAAPTATAATVPQNVELKLSVTSVRGDFGGYIVNDHTGPAKQTPFTVDKSGKWSKTITVPNNSMVKLDIARIGARCEIRYAPKDELLATDENSCIVGG